MQTRPATPSVRPPTRTGPPGCSCVPDACRGIPSAYPSGTSPSTVSCVVTYWCAYETPCPPGTVLTFASSASSVIAGTSP